MARAVWLYYMCKITELLDTVFFVLRKKQNQISFLHLYHHTLMPICGFIGIKYFAGKLTSSSLSSSTSSRLIAIWPIDQLTTMCAFHHCCRHRHWLEWTDWCSHGSNEWMNADYVSNAMCGALHFMLSIFHSFLYDFFIRKSHCHAHLRVAFCFSFPLETATPFSLVV